MKKILAFFSLIVCIVSCTLNAEQEQFLSEQMSIYFNARNKGNSLVYVSLTHPDVVKYYHNQGDSVFMQKFKKDSANVESDYYFGTAELYYNPIIKKRENEGQNYQVLIEAEYKNKDSQQLKANFYALSTNGAKTWFFVDSADFYNKNIKINFKRIF